LAEGAVCSELVSGRKSLFGRENTGRKPMIGMPVDLVKTSKVGPEHVKFRSKQ